MGIKYKTVEKYKINVKDETPITAFDIERYMLVPFPYNVSGFMNRHQIDELAQLGKIKPYLSTGTKRKTNYYKQDEIKLFAKEFVSNYERLRKVVPILKPISPEWLRSNR